MAQNLYIGNILGATGPAGPSGIAGPSGASGLMGPTGPAGGPTGATGPIGPSGNMGATGPDGFTPLMTGLGTNAGLNLSTLVTGSIVSFTVVSGLQFTVGSYIKACNATGSANHYVQGEVSFYGGTTLSLDVNYIQGGETYSSWKLATAGYVGPQGQMGATGPAGGVGVVNEGYYFRTLNNAPDSGVLYHNNSNDYVGVNTVNPDAQLDISGDLRIRTTHASSALTSGHLVINPASGYVHSVTPKLDYQILDGDGSIQSFVLESPCRGKEWLLLWDMTAEKLISPNDYSVNNTILTFDSTKIPAGDIEARNIVLW